MARCGAKLAILSGTGIPTINLEVQVVYLHINIKRWLAWQDMAYVCYAKLNGTGVSNTSSPQVP